MCSDSEVRAVLQGCAQLVPCQAEQSDCRLELRLHMFCLEHFKNSMQTWRMKRGYDMYGCVSVQPGSSCRIRCQASVRYCSNHFLAPPNHPSCIDDMAAACRFRSLARRPREHVWMATPPPTVWLHGINMSCRC